MIKGGVHVNFKPTKCNCLLSIRVPQVYILRILESPTIPVIKDDTLLDRLGVVILKEMSSHHTDIIRSVVDCILSKYADDKAVCSSKGGQLKRWEELFTEQLYHEPPVANGDALKKTTFIFGFKGCPNYGFHTCLY